MDASIYCAFVGSRGKKNVCKTCAKKQPVQTLCKQNVWPGFVQTLCKGLARRGAWLASGASRPSPVGQNSVREQNRPATVLRKSAPLVPQQRGLDRRPVKQDATPAKPHARNFASLAPVEQRAAANWQPRQQLLLVNEARLGCGWFALVFTHTRTDFIRIGAGDSAIIAQNDLPDLKPASRILT